MGSKRKTKYFKSGKFNHQVAKQCKIAKSLMFNNKLDEAESILKIALAAEPKDSYVLVGLGDIKRRKREFIQAAEYYEQCLKYDQINRFALAGLGDSHRGNQDIESAIKVWSKTLSIYPDFFQVITRLADAFGKTGSLDKAKKLYKDALNINPDDPYALSGLGNLYVRQHLFDKAEPLLKKLAKRQRNNSRALCDLANFYRKQDRHEKADKIFDQILSFDPYNVFALDAGADCARRLKDYTRSTQMWEKAIDAGMDPVVAKTRIADGYLQLGKLENARKYYQDVLSKSDYKYALLGKLRLLEKEDSIEEVKVQSAGKLFNRLFEQKSKDTRILSEFIAFQKRHPGIISICQP